MYPGTGIVAGADGFGCRVTGQIPEAGAAGKASLLFTKKAGSNASLFHVPD